MINCKRLVNNIRRTKIIYLWKETIKLLGKILAKPTIQAIFNAIMMFFTSIVCSNAVDSVTHQLKWKLVLLTIALYIIMTLIFMKINKKITLENNTCKGTLYNIRKLMKARGETLLRRSHNKDQWVLLLENDIQNEEYSYCACIFEQVCEYLHCNSSELEVILFQNFDNNTDDLLVLPVAYQADVTPKCISSNIPINYNIATIFNEKKSIKYLKPEEVQNGFSYNGTTELSAEEQKENEKIKQYIAVPLITRRNVVIATIQLCFFDEIIGKEIEADNIINDIIRPFGDYIEYILCEQLGIENQLQ